MINEHFVLLGALCSFAGSTKYVLETLRGRTRPNRVSFFLWALLPLIAFAAELGDGVGWTALMSLTVCVGPAVIFAVSFVDKNAYWQIGRFDYVCGALSLAALGGWAITRHGTIAIAFSILADFIAGIPTIKKAYTHPHTESASAFLGGWCNALIALLTITAWTFDNFGFPLYILTVNTIIIGFALFSPRRRTTAPAETAAY